MQFTKNWKMKKIKQLLLKLSLEIQQHWNNCLNWYTILQSSLTVHHHAANRSQLLFWHDFDFCPYKKTSVLDYKWEKQSVSVVCQCFSAPRESYFIDFQWNRTTHSSLTQAITKARFIGPLLTRVCTFACIYPSLAHNSGITST